MRSWTRGTPTLLARRIPDARVELFPGAGHLFFWEQPDRFVEIVTEFLGGVGSERASGVLCLLERPSEH